jgi:hypothetical protein
LEKDNFLKKKSSVLSVSLLFFFAAIVMMRQLTTPGYFSVNINDTYTYVGWSWQFVEALKEGILYPRWTPVTFWGYGNPTFIYYPPFSFYFAAVFNVLTGSVVSAMNVTKFAALFLSSTGMFFLVREFFSESIAFLSASLYMLFPYIIFEFYLSGTFASTISLIWLSPIVLFLYRYIRDGSFKQVLYAGFFYGGLILTHLITAYMFTFVMAAFVTYLSLVWKRIKRLIAIPATILAGALLSAVYLMPLLYERNLVNFRAFIGEGVGFDFSHFFLFPYSAKQLPRDHFWVVYYPTYLFLFSIVCILTALFFIQSRALARSKGMDKSCTVTTFFLALATSSIFLLFGVSSAIWESVPFFRYIQFPVRWLTVTVFAVGFLSASGFWTIQERFRTKRWRHYLVLSVFFFICAWPDFRYVSHAYVFGEKEVLPVRSGNWTIEHLPAGVDFEKLDEVSNPEGRALIVRGEGKTEVVSWKSAERVVRVNSRRPSSLRIRTFNFPGWTAYVDGAMTPLRTEKGTGAIIVDIPQGEHRLELRFEDTPIRLYSKLISIVSFLALAFTLVFLRRKGNIDK